MSNAGLSGSSGAAAGISTQNGSIALIDDPDVDGNISQTVFFDPPFPVIPIITGLTLRRLLNSTIDADDMNGVLITSVAEYGFSFTVNTNLITLPDPVFVDWEASHGEVIDPEAAELPSIYTDNAFALSLVGEGASARINAKTIDGLGFIIDWGDGTIDTSTGDTTFTHAYASAYTGLVHISSVSGGHFTYMQSTLGKFVTDIAVFPRTLTTLDFRGAGSDIYGDIKDAPPSLQTLWLTGSSTLGGDVKDIPENFGTSFFIISGLNTITGDIGTIPATSLNNTVQFHGQNTLYGLIQDLQVGVFGGSMHITGQNTISGDIGLMDSAHEISSFNVIGQNTITGDIGLMPPKLGFTIFLLQANNTIYGNIEDWPVNASPVTTIDIRGFNTIGGDLGAANFSTSTFNLYGNHTIGGDVANFNGDLVTSIFNLGSSTDQGANAITGDIANIPITFATTDFNVFGNNTLTGDLKNKPVGVGIRHFQIYGNADFTYSGGITLLQNPVNSMYYAPLVLSGNGLTSIEVDQFLIDTAAIGWSSTAIKLIGNNAPRTAASDAAVVTLNSNSVTVTTN